uniref:Uncharacterized protein n=1 Tax=Alexandrium monilatum TaxID=311494 RepID=A0A7S4QSN5_9DINO
MFELPLQLKVFLTFLEFRERTFVRAFFESGVLVPLMRALSDDDLDAPDGVRCLVLVVLRKLAANGRHHKELLCGQGLVPTVLACVSDALRWETLKCAGRLLCELFLANPSHQAEVLDGLQDLMAKRVPLTQRVGMQAIISLLAGEEDMIPSLLCDPARHWSLTQLALRLLSSQDLRVNSDAYCLLSRLVRAFNCDELLFDFARGQLVKEKDLEREWLRLEIEGREFVRDLAGEQPPALGGRYGGTFQVIHRRISEAISGAGGPPPQDADGALEMVRRANRCTAEFREAFLAEASCILKLGLVLLLARRNAAFCSELVAGGLTETLLMSVLDVKHPVRQAAALNELHLLRVLSPDAERVAVKVLRGEEVLRALTLEQFTLAVGPAELSNARFRLRNLQLNGRSAKFSAREHDLHLQIVERHMAESYGISMQPRGAQLFLTQAEEAEEAAGQAAAEAEDAVPRSGPRRFDVKRLPRLEGKDAPPGSPGRLLTGSQRYFVDRGPIEEMPGGGYLTDYLMDPLEATADEESSLLREVRGIESIVGLGSAAPAPASAPARPARGPRPSHRPSLQHSRALALRSVPPPGVEPRRPATGGAPTAAAPSRASSEFTEVSLRCGPLSTVMRLAAASAAAMAGTQQEPAEGRAAHACRGHHLRTGEASSGKPPPLSQQQQLQLSLAETSVGQDQCPSEELSRELHSLSYHDPLPVEDSRMTLASDSLEMPSTMLSTVGDEDFAERSATVTAVDGAEPPLVPRFVERSAVAAVVEVSRVGAGASGSVGGTASARRSLSARPQRRVVQVAPPPYHDCVAFRSYDTEEERERAHREACGLIHPVTRKRFQDLRSAGSFPRRSVGTANVKRAASSGPGAVRSPEQAAVSLLSAAAAAPASARAVAPAAAPLTPAPASARQARPRGGTEGGSMFKPMQAGTATLSDRGRKSSPRGHSPRLGLVRGALAAEVFASERLQPPLPSNTKGSMKAFFPACVKAALN